jgi:ABC-2 type transport system ATP-binding protein
MPIEGGGGVAGPAATLSGVSHRFGHRSRHRSSGVTALRDVDLTLRNGTITALVGANGSGKTTLLRILAGIVAPSEGEVEVLGVPRPARSGRSTLRALRRRVSYLSQDPALDPEMTGREVLSLLATLHGVTGRERERRVAELADGFGVTGHLGRRVGTWSGGLRRRLHLAAGLVLDPALLLLDEPTAGLDPEGRRLLWADLEARAAGGAAVAVVTHDLAAAERSAGQVAILDRGTVAAAGSPEELRGADGDGLVDLAEAYRRLTGREAAELLPPPRDGRGGWPGRKGR